MVLITLYQKVKLCVRRKNNQKIASIAHFTAFLKLGIK
ncbi:hypothetical protein STBHUCCB_27720 [Salmonella enterica subsp. enterica serovar Typhi str. P-stx-12]|nr:hypothetical protein STBHUCCB_27720 [Salmonella enterica subsp. enterica serovar Typhi str. P-stx-12]AXR58665.1 hypothetical protein CJP42_3845 [Salmonella enterica subsp. enterica serovar Typhi]EHC68669.1 hypothetical protein LTSEMIS_3700 [Salmonella enterica subsp. enterica serovar Mississippi str. A4-633]